MNNRSAIISIVATILLLGLRFVEPHQLQSGARRANHNEGLYCSLSVSSTLVLAESKPKIDSFDASSFFGVFSLYRSTQQEIAELVLPGPVILCVTPPPLWLLNRSLLI